MQGDIWIAGLALLGGMLLYVAISIYFSAWMKEERENKRKAKLESATIFTLLRRCQGTDNMWDGLQRAATITMTDWKWKEAVEKARQRKVTEDDIADEYGARNR